MRDSSAAELVVNASHDGRRARESIEVILSKARIATIIQCYRYLDEDTSWGDMQVTCDRVSSSILRKLRASEMDGRMLIGEVWSSLRTEIRKGQSRAKREHKSESAATMQACNIGGAGATLTLEKAFIEELDDVESQLITLRVSGFRHDDVADAMDRPVGETRKIYRIGIAKLRQCQQLPTDEQLLWESVRTSLSSDAADAFRDTESPTRLEEPPSSYRT
jgi:hypothetical protein